MPPQSWQTHHSQREPNHVRTSYPERYIFLVLFVILFIRIMKTLQKYRPQERFDPGTCAIQHSHILYIPDLDKRYPSASPWRARFWCWCQYRSEATATCNCYSGGVLGRRCRPVHGYESRRYLSHSRPLAWRYIRSRGREPRLSSKPALPNHSHTRAQDQGLAESPALGRQAENGFLFCTK